MKLGTACNILRLDSVMKLEGHTYDTLDEIVEGCLRNERLAQKRLYDLYAGRMAAVCLRYVGDRDDALDLMHDGFVKLFTNLAQYNGNGSFEAWMRKIFVNVSLERLRKNDALRGSEDVNGATFQMDNGDVSVIEKMSADEIMQLVSELPVGFRTVFNMYAIEGYSHQEIAARLGINEVTSRSQFLRARAALQAKIKQLYI